MQHDNIVIIIIAAGYSHIMIDQPATDIKNTLQIIIVKTIRQLYVRACRFSNRENTKINDSHEHKFLLHCMNSKKALYNATLQLIGSYSHQKILFSKHIFLVMHCALTIIRCIGLSLHWVWHSRKQSHRNGYKNSKVHFHFLKQQLLSKLGQSVAEVEIARCVFKGVF